jgi:hypothetical protein
MSADVTIFHNFIFVKLFFDPYLKERLFDSFSGQEYRIPNRGGGKFFAAVAKYPN